MSGLQRMVGCRRAWGWRVLAAVTAACSWDEYPSDEAFASEPYLWNDSDEALEIAVHPLRADLRIDCAEVSADPGALLPPTAFEAEVTTVVVEPEVEVPLDAALVGEGGTTCAAVLLEGDDGPSVVFWLADEIFPENFDTPRLLAIVAREGLQGLWFQSELDLVHAAHSLRPAPGESACETFPSTDDAPAVVPHGIWRLTQIDATDADCARLHLAPGALASPDDAEELFDLCALPEELPFAVDDTLEIEGGAGEVLIVARPPTAAHYDPPSGVLFRGRVDAPLWPFDRLDLRPSTVDPCAPMGRDQCLDVHRPLVLDVRIDHVSAGTIAATNASLEIAEDDGAWTIRVVRAAEHLVVEPSCEYDGPLAVPDLVAWASWRATPGG